jgi:hypothetical protein
MKNLIANWNQFIADVFGHHWYVVKCQYKDKEGRDRWSVTSQVGILKQRNILDHKMVKQTVNIGEIISENDLFADNGTVQCEVLCYLGRFKRKTK